MPYKRTQVLVCAGTGCTIGNSGELIEEFEKEIKSMGLDREIEVLRTGCLGLCGAGPVSYTHLDVYKRQLYH